MVFRYLRDRLFLLCASAYVCNRFVLKEVWQRGFFNDHFNDLICIPFLVPIMLYIQRRLRMRRHDGAPLWYELLIPLITWALVFEVLLPAHPGFHGIAVADHMDVLCYALGAFGAAMYWRFQYQVVKPHDGWCARATDQESAVRTVLGYGGDQKQKRQVAVVLPWNAVGSEKWA